MSIRSHHALGGLLAVVVLAAAACSSSSSTPAPTPAPTAAPTAAPTTPAGGGGGGGGGQGAGDAASVLTSDVAASIIGGTVTSVPIPTGVPGMSVASYTNTAGDGVTVLIEPVPAGIGASVMQAAIQAAGAKGELTPLSGLGDSGGKVVNDHDATVAFTKGNNLVVLYASAAGSAGADIESKLENLGRQIAGKL